MVLGPVWVLGRGLHLVFQRAPEPALSNALHRAVMEPVPLRAGLAQEDQHKRQVRELWHDVQKCLHHVADVCREVDDCDEGGLPGGRVTVVEVCQHAAEEALERGLPQLAVPLGVVCKWGGRGL